MSTPPSSRSPDSADALPAGLDTLSLDELLQRVHALVRGGVEDMPPADQVARGQLRARLLNEEEQFDFGYAEGYEAGYAAAHSDMAEWFALVSRLVRQRAGHPAYAERAEAEAEWVKPREGDYLGRLSREQYFGIGTPRLAAAERRAA
ncbi:MAG TPA: hypothetical protein VFA06_03040 [Actinocrinis sp.]|uniref:hypothetical protein n=1 Tax=Actinocrinis sp. TaxID=1920516 RepID=UPI002D691FFE|nr:hypothetical protein [Actinocrinis sp.]HZU54824.1 hypothetical protein [Actinocrinis sp.]